MQKHRERGAALIVGLIFLAILTVLGVTSIKSSIMEQKMAANEQLRMEAFQMAQSIVDDVVKEPANFPVNGTPGYTNCTAGMSGCNDNTIVLDTTYSAYPGTETAKVERVQPNVNLPPRAVAASAASFSAAVFQVTGTYDGSAEGLGTAEVVQGYLMLIAKGAQ